MTYKKMYMTAYAETDPELNELILELQRVGLREKYSIIWYQDLIENNKNIILDHIIDNGISSLLEQGMAQDAVLTAAMPQQSIIHIFHRHISYLSSPSKLIIIDPYFYGTPETLCEPFTKIISPIIGQLQNIYIICNRKNSRETISKLNSEIIALNKPELSIKNILTDNFHDRFWINPDNNRAFVVGTSFNGIGKKICLIQKISEADTIELLGLLVKEGLVYN